MLFDNLRTKFVPSVLVAIIGLGLTSFVCVGTATAAGCNTSNLNISNISINSYYIKLAIQNRAGEDVQLIWKGGDTSLLLAGQQIASTFSLSDLKNSSGGFDLTLLAGLADAVGGSSQAEQLKQVCQFTLNSVGDGGIQIDPSSGCATAVLESIQFVCQSMTANDNLQQLLIKLQIR